MERKAWLWYLMAHSCKGEVHHGEESVASGDRHIVSIGKKQKDEC